jgi:hypothetical protein
MFAAKSGENIRVTPAGKDSGSGSSKELIEEIRNLGDRLDQIQKFNIRIIDDVEISKRVESGTFTRKAV